MPLQKRQKCFFLRFFNFSISDFLSIFVIQWQFSSCQVIWKQTSDLFHFHVLNAVIIESRVKNWFLFIKTSLDLQTLPEIFGSELQVCRHIQSEHVGSGVGADPPFQHLPDLCSPIFDFTGYEVKYQYPTCSRFIGNVRNLHLWFWSNHS